MVCNIFFMYFLRLYQLVLCAFIPSLLHKKKNFVAMHFPIVNWLLCVTFAFVFVSVFLAIFCVGFSCVCHGFCLCFCVCSGL